MSRYVDIERLVPMQVENSEVELGILVYDYDAVQYEPFIDIVRCVECRYKGMEICPMYKLTKAGVLKPYDFCSYGEREGE